MSTIPDRVRGLIEATGLSQHAFATRIGLDDSKMSKSLSGARRFSSLDLARIAELCDVTVDWLITGEEPPLALAARTTGGKAGAALAAAKHYGALRTDMAAFGHRLPWHPLPARLGTGGYVDRGRRLAAEASSFLDQRGYAILDGDLISLVENAFGVDVAVVELGTGFDGMAVSSEEVKLIILATSYAPTRQCFTLAHELCHLLAGDDQEVHLDRDVFDKGQARDPSEMQANAFAAAFLMPEGILRQRAGSSGFTKDTFAELSWELRVTPSALAYRLLHLRLIDAGTCDRYKTITAAEAANIAGRSEQFARWITQARTPRPPGLLVRDTYAAYESGEATLRPYANLLGADVDELRRTLAAEPGANDAL